MEDVGQQQNSQNDKTDEETSRPQYSMSGVLHYIQHEWTRYELERSRWEAERAEMQARIAFLQGERKGQENLKSDLVRRIKMLEFCLKQERAKVYRLTHNGDEPPNYDEVPDENSAPTENHLAADLDSYINDTESTGNFRQGRLLLKRYLEEIGYRLIAPSDLPNNDAVNGKKGKSDSDSDDENLLDMDASKALDEFDFLHTDSDLKNDDDWSGNQNQYDALVRKYNIEKENRRKPRNSEDDSSSESLTKNLETDVPPGIASAIAASAAEGLPTRRQGRRSQNFAYGNGGASSEINAALGISNEENMDIKDEFGSDQDDPSMQAHKWSTKISLRSHLDSIWAMQFHPVEPVLFTASEDGTVKLWNLEAKKEDKHGSGTGEIEPIYTFRGHMGPVVCLVLNPTGDHLYTGGRDGNLCCWNVPALNSDPCDAYDPRVLAETLNGHTDVIWSVAYHSSNGRLVSASSDSTIKLWEPGNSEPLIRTINPPKPSLVPTSVDFVSTETTHLLAAYTNCFAQILDIETGASVMVFDFGAEATGRTLNKIVSHPTMPISVIGGEDRTIRYFDNTTGKLIHESLAHIEGVSSLAIDPNGLFLLSGSHDGSLRVWNIEKKVCLQEISAHRKKNDNAVTSVAFHPSKPLIGSSGADSVAKIYVAASN
ncbi:unnamed protein product [Caenorhabditis angaria]|uniref:Striatin N-terminal domain-containing protein n=1 Tax=Caenorhabditis angaria TaxID=860376 RepID=A0A9P1N5A9_9PELO|nr:unnamed protein product [Caenorhabditis angaria]